MRNGPGELGPSQGSAVAGGVVFGSVSRLNH